MRVRVEVEDQIHTYANADNGAGPLWCHGSTIVARAGDTVFVAGLETLPDQVPLNNTRWVLFRRAGVRRAGPGAGWELTHRDETGRTREPSPVALLAAGDLLVSANPTLAAPGAYSGPAEPTVFRFATSCPNAVPATERPVWRGEPHFSEHSYRTVSADGARGQVLYLQNEGYELAHMSLRQNGTWCGLGAIRWPFGDRYPKPQPLRLCYPNVMLRDGAAHFLGVGDIVEPIDAWRAAKRQITGRDWDYVFRRLFYAMTPDVASQPFGPWLELADRDETAGATRNCDLWVSADGTAHVLWIDVSTDARIRDRFFPGVEVRQSLEHAAVRGGRVVARRTLAALGQAEDGLQPELARFHVTADGRALVLAQFARRPAPASGTAILYRAAWLDDGDPRWVDVPFARPLGGTFLTNTVRGGSAPGDTIDLVGTVAGPALGYAQIRVEG